jgi:hypothetical protein
MSQGGCAGELAVLPTTRMDEQPSPSLVRHQTLPASECSENRTTRALIQPRVLLPLRSLAPVRYAMSGHVLASYLFLVA